MKVFSCLLVLVAAFTCCLSNEDLYNILGVSKRASQQEIKRAYKKLAREWHPDKNRAPDANERFMKINEAYETLSDTERRSDYDNFGYTSAQERPQNNFHNGFHPFDQFFGGSGFEFRFQGRGESVIEKHTITFRHFETKLNPETHRQPCILYVYGDFCFSCLRIEHLIEKLFTEMKNIGLCVASVHVRERMLVSHLRIQDIPTIMGVVNSRQTFFRGPYSMQGLRDFVRSLFPKDIVLQLNGENYEQFLNGWSDNHVRAIFFSERNMVPARFLAPAFYFRHRIKFGHVSTYASSSNGLVKKFNVNRNRETLLVFNEEWSTPVATISMQHLSRSTLDEVLEANQFLLLPRLSSQSVFDDLCPVEPKLKKRKLCVVLVTRKGEARNQALMTSFRSFAQSLPADPQRLRFVYIYQDTQHNVISALTKGNKTRTDSVLEVAIMWRMDNHRLSYEFLESGWPADDAMVGLSRKQLEHRLNELLLNDRPLLYKALIPEFYNEHALGLMYRILNRLYDWGEKIFYFFITFESPSMMLITLGIIVIGTIVVFLKGIAAQEDEQIKKAYARMQKRPPSRSPDEQTLHLYELRGDSYDSLVKEADTGLTIVVLVDEASKETLVHHFAQIMRSYFRYSALTFAFTQLEYHLSWYQHLLELSLDYKVKLENINIQNCVGTVLAINGYRRYFYIFHPKSARHWMRRHCSNISKAIGFYESDESEGEAEQDGEPVTSQVLDGLDIWMDRIFDGSITKIRVPFWPEMDL